MWVIVPTEKGMIGFAALEGGLLQTGCASMTAQESSHKKSQESHKNIQTTRSS